MKKKIIQILFLCAILINTMIISAGTVTYASDAEEPEISELESILPYADILDELNEELGTSFAFPTNEVLERAGMNREEVIADILSTEVENYEQLIRNQYGNFNQESSSGVMDNNEQIVPMATTETSKAYYASSTNYVSVTATTYYADGANRYSSIDSYSYGYTTTPFYKPYDMTSTISSGSTNVNCAFYSYKMLNASVSYDSWEPHKLTATFTAGGGNTTATIVY